MAQLVVDLVCKCAGFANVTIICGTLPEPGQTDFTLTVWVFYCIQGLANAPLVLVQEKLLRLYLNRLPNGILLSLRVKLYGRTCVF